jgi:hypothetical protein
MRYIILVICFFHVNHFFTQTVDTLALRYAETIKSEHIAKHLFTLASDEFEGRETGMPGQKKAAQYISTYYESLKISPVVGGSWFQSYPLRRESNMGSLATIGSERKSFLDDFYFFGMPAQDLSASQIVFVGYGIRDERHNDYKGFRSDVIRPVVMCLNGEPMDAKGRSRITGSNETSDWNDDVLLKALAAEKMGAQMLLVVNTNYNMYMKRVRYWLEQSPMRLERDNEVKEDEHIPIIYISPAMANQIMQASGKTVEGMQARINKGKRQKPVVVSQDLFFHVEQKIDRIKAENVLAFIEGSDSQLKEEVVVVSAHYDHVGIINGEIHNGADDDASGTSAAMEIAEAFNMAKRDGHGPKRSVLILHVSGEEKGLLGSQWYSDHPVFPLEKTVCDLNIDMIGRIDPEHKDSNYVYLIGSDKLSTDLHKISDSCNQNYSGLSLDYTYNKPDDPNRFYYRSDHYNFAKHNIPVIFYFSGVHEDYHKPGDDAKKIGYKKMERITRLVFHTAWEVANRPDRLRVDVVSDFKN